MAAIDLATKIRDIPDFPQKGILFKDITTLLKDPEAFRHTIDLICDAYRDKKVDLVAAVESRGFILAGPVAYNLGAGFIPIRKLGKLPAESIRVDYALEYGTNTLEMHKDAIEPGQRVLVVDDLLATGGTVAASVDLIEQLNGEVVGLVFLIELLFLNGRDKLPGRDILSLIQF
jgi:adenine phosphoribosyltransferase